MDGEHYLIEPSIGLNRSEINNQHVQSIPHSLYKLKHSQKNTVPKENGTDSHCAVDTGK